MLTLRQISEEYGLSLWWARKLARGNDFPPLRRVRGRNKLYAVADVRNWWAGRVRKRPAPRSERWLRSFPTPIKGHKLRVKDVAERTGYTPGTVYEYLRREILPPPRERIGTTMLFAAEDIDLYLKGRLKAKR